MEVLQMFEKSHVLDPTSHFIHYARNRFQQIAFSLDETWQVAQLGCHVLGMKTHMKLLGDSLLESEIPFESAWRSDIHFCFFDQHSQVFLEVKIEHKKDTLRLPWILPTVPVVKSKGLNLSVYTLMLGSVWPMCCPEDGRISTRKWQEGKLISCQEPFPGRKAGHHRSFFFFQSQIDIIGEIFSFHIFHEFWGTFSFEFWWDLCEFSKVLPKQTTNKRVLPFGPTAGGWPWGALQSTKYFQFRLSWLMIRYYSPEI